MILEGIVTTRNEDGTTNVAPMGPLVEPSSMATLWLRPFQTSQTFANLVREREGVFHVTDDVLLIAQAVAGQLTEPPETFPARHVAGKVLADACRWYEFRVESVDDSQERTQLTARVVHVGRLRDFLGFNRAKHAVVEAAILASRVHLLDRAELRQQWAALRVPVEKTAGAQERAAFALLTDFVAAQLGDLQ